MDKTGAGAGEGQNEFAAYANPAYGSGVFRRRIRLENTPGAVHAELEDCSHGFRLHLGHDGAKVTSIAVEALRIPFTTCNESEQPLRSLIGCPLAADWAQFQARLPGPANCTHLRDLAWCALAHAQRSETVRDYEIAIADEGAAPAECTLHRNGTLLLRWQVSRGAVVAPADIAGGSLLQGFAAWARPAFRGEDFEAATMLQRGYLVAGGRRLDKQALAGTHALVFKGRRGACFTYSPGAVERAVATAGTERDFTNTPELLLKYK